MSSVDGGAVLATMGWSALVVLLLQAFTFGVGARLGKHVYVDTVWGPGFVLVALTAFVTSGEAEATARWLLLVLTGLWGVRLAVHIGRRSRGAPEDPRYADLVARHQGHPLLVAAVRIYLTQAAALWFVSLPLQVGAHQTGGPGPLTWLGVLVWAVGLTFEAVGDWQLDRFRRDPGSRGRVLDTGLWRYSRHPNYFGDACVWWGLFLVAAHGWPGVLTVLSPLLMTWLLARGTGKPLLERGIGQRRPGYADYVRRTSGFVPLPPRRAQTASPERNS